MKMRPFERTDWDAFAGAEAWPCGGQPLIGEGELEDGTSYVLVLDPNGACLVVDDEQAINGGYAIVREFLSPEAALTFAESLGQPKLGGEFFMAGFRPV